MLIKKIQAILLKVKLLTLTSHEFCLRLKVFSVGHTNSLQFDQKQTEEFQKYISKYVVHKHVARTCCPWRRHL